MLNPSEAAGFLGLAEITGLWHSESQALRQEYRRWGWGTQPRVTSSPPFTQCIPRIPHNAPSPWAPVGHPRLWFGLLHSALWAGPKGCRNAHDKSATWCLHSPAEAALSLAPRLKQIPLLLTPLPSTACITCILHCVPPPGAPTVILTQRTGIHNPDICLGWDTATL